MKNLKIATEIIIVLLIIFASSSLYAQDFNLLPDGTTFSFWNDMTKYSRIYHVAKNNQRASDDNPGTAEKPFKTINAAARLLQPGEKVIVHEGIYRECIRPARGGTSSERMISYEAGAGEKVVIKGSEIWKPEVKPSSGWQSSSEVSGTTILMADIPEEFFKAYNPFLARNTYHYLATYGMVTDPEWLKRTLLFRGMVFSDGKPLKQVYAIGELSTTDNAFWVEDPGLRLHFRLSNDDDPAKHFIEITTREQIFAPRDYGLGYIRVSGFVFEQAADGPPVPQRAIVSTMQGHHWIIENNRIEWANACGLDIGAQSWDADVREHFGFHVLRNNTIRNCGICGIAGAQGAERVLIEGNIIENIGFHDLERMWECSAIKFHGCKNSLIRNNIIRHIKHASGLWLDCNTTNVRTTNNVFADIQSISGGFYSEMNYDLNLVDYNLFWDIGNDKQIPYNAITQAQYGATKADCNEKLIVCHNFFGRIVMNAISFSLVQADRRTDGRTGLGYANSAVNNVFYECPRRIYLARKLENQIDGNLYDQNNKNYSFILEFPTPLSIQNFDGWQEYFGFDKHSTQAKIKADFDIDNCILKINIDGEMPDCQVIKNLINDKFTGSYPGPFRPGSIKKDSKTQIIEQKFPL